MDDSGLDGGEGVYYGDSGGWCEVEVCRGDLGIGLFADEGEAGFGAVGFLDLDGRDGTVGGHGEGKALHALFLSVRNAEKGKGAVGGGRHGQVIDFFFKLGVAEEEAQR